MDAWRRRKVVEEIDRRKELHIAALHTKDFDPEKQDLASKLFEDTEEMYERLKDEAYMTDADREAMDKAADTPFMRAGRRSLARAVQRIEPVMPGEQSIRRLPEDPGDPW